MIKVNNETPVVILNCHIGGLAIARTLGKVGIDIYGVNGQGNESVIKSKYFKQIFTFVYDEKNDDLLLNLLDEIHGKIGKKCVLIPTSDEYSVFVSRNAEKLQNQYFFSGNDPELMSNLISKKQMYYIAKENQVPTPTTLFPANLQDLKNNLDELRFPVMLKGDFGNRLYKKTGKKMVVIHSEEELLHLYNEMEDPENPNLMIQELIPGDDDQVYIFNGYFNEKSDCLLAFTGRKIRQFPIHIGCASLGECFWYDDLADLTINFMKNINYKGVLDIGYRLDPRDGQYKVLDINPRVGQAFRLFVGKENVDVVRAQYMDLTGQPVPPSGNGNGRRWMIEDFDLISSYEYYKEGTLKFKDWFKSYAQLKEAAWFDLGDPLPFVFMMRALLGMFLRKLLKGLSWK